MTTRGPPRPGRPGAWLAWGLIALMLLAAPAGAAPPGPVDFAHDIVPILKTHCAKCHANGTYKGSFSLDTREAMLKSESVVPGKSDESELIERLTSATTPTSACRPRANRLARRRGRAAAGVDRPGAALGAGVHVQERRLRRAAEAPAAGAAARRDGRDHPIDRILDAYWPQHKISPPPPLDDAAFVRRRLPRRDRPASHARGAERLPRRPGPGQARAPGPPRCSTTAAATPIHWLTFWNDLLRNDYAGTGYIDGGRKQITGWLYQSLLENKPYDRFVTRADQPDGRVGRVHQRASSGAGGSTPARRPRSSSRRTSRRSSSAST